MYCAPAYSSSHSPSLWLFACPAPSKLTNAAWCIQRDSQVLGVAWRRSAIGLRQIEWRIPDPVPPLCTFEEKTPCCMVARVEATRHMHARFVVAESLVGHGHSVTPEGMADRRVAGCRPREVRELALSDCLSQYAVHSVILSFCHEVRYTWMVAIRHAGVDGGNSSRIERSGESGRPRGGTCPLNGTGKAHWQLEVRDGAIIPKPAIVIPREDAWAYRPEHPARLEEAMTQARFGRALDLSPEQLERLVDKAHD